MHRQPRLTPIYFRWFPKSDKLGTRSSQASSERYGLAGIPPSVFRPRTSGTAAIHQAEKFELENYRRLGQCAKRRKRNAATQSGFGRNSAAERKANGHGRQIESGQARKRKPLEGDGPYATVASETAAGMSFLDSGAGVV